MINLDPEDRLLRLSEVKNKTAKSRSAIYKEMNAGTFPKNVSLGGRSVAWIQSEINAWIVEKIKERKK